MTTDDPEWDAAAVDRFNATFDAGMKRLAIDHKETHMPEPVYVHIPANRWPTMPPGRPSRDYVPLEIQDEIMARAQDRRDRKQIRNLRNIGHALNCAMDMAIGHQPCSCEKGASNE